MKKMNIAGRDIRVTWAYNLPKWEKETFDQLKKLVESEWTEEFLKAKNELLIILCHSIPEDEECFRKIETLHRAPISSHKFWYGIYKGLQIGPVILYLIET